MRATSLPPSQPRFVPRASHPLQSTRASSAQPSRRRLLDLLSAKDSSPVHRPPRHASLHCHCARRPRPSATIPAAARRASALQRLLSRNPLSSRNPRHPRTPPPPKPPRPRNPPPPPLPLPQPPNPKPPPSASTTPSCPSHHCSS